MYSSPLMLSLFLTRCSADRNPWPYVRKALQLASKFTLTLQPVQIFFLQKGPLNQILSSCVFTDINTADQLAKLDQIGLWTNFSISSVLT